MARAERSLRKLPWWLYLSLLFALLAQGWAHQHSSNQHEQPPQAHPLPMPPELNTLQRLSLDEPGLLSRVLSLWLLHFDSQSGVSLSFHDYDYKVLKRWLHRLSELDSSNRFPSLAAVHVYAAVRDSKKAREMIEFVREKYVKNPYTQWRWLAESVIIAKYRLHDLPLALEMAQALADTPPRGIIPTWAQQMAIFVYEDMGEFESSVILLETLLSSGKITDPNERLFLRDRLRLLKNRIVERSTDSH